jgi:hypothetical protein
MPGFYGSIEGNEKHINNILMIYYLTVTQWEIIDKNSNIDHNQSLFENPNNRIKRWEKYIHSKIGSDAKYSEERDIEKGYWGILECDPTL